MRLAFDATLYLLQTTLELSRTLPSIVSFSGGNTRPNDEAVRSGEVTNSEGEGQLEWARTKYPDADLSDVLVERFARDSFENIFFSLLAYFHSFGTWPACVHVVTWPFKANRSYLIACGLRLGDGRFFFHGCGDLISQQSMEIVTQANVEYEQGIVSGKQIIDPLHRSADFARKRAGRMPQKYRDNREYIDMVKRAYDREIEGECGLQHPVSTIIDVVENTREGAEWRGIRWPWCTP
ncbi:MAG: hypothetical protein ACLQOO_20840 [Terriglobia bacterium]